MLPPDLGGENSLEYGPECWLCSARSLKRVAVAVQQAALGRQVLPQPQPYVLKSTAQRTDTQCHGAKPNRPTDRRRRRTDGASGRRTAHSTCLETPSRRLQDRKCVTAFPALEPAPALARSEASSGCRWSFRASQAHFVALCHPSAELRPT